MRNLRLAFRTLARTPFVSLVAILSLALGLGANSAIFSLFNQILLRPLPVPAPQALVNLGAPGPKPGSHSCNQAGDLRPDLQLSDVPRPRAGAGRASPALRRTGTSASTSPSAARPSPGAASGVGQLLPGARASSPPSAGSSRRTMTGRLARINWSSSATSTGGAASRRTRPCWARPSSSTGTA